jgi:hypothetical protein
MKMMIESTKNQIQIIERKIKEIEERKFALDFISRSFFEFKDDHMARMVFLRENADNVPFLSIYALYDLKEVLEHNKILVKEKNQELQYLLLLKTGKGQVVVIQVLIIFEHTSLFV